MTRGKDWAEKLFGEFVPSCGTKPFTWGEFDCCLFVADAVKVQTGTDMAETVRGTYTDGLGAARMLQEFGGMEAMAAAMAAQHGLEEIAIGLAQRGDVVLVCDPTIDTCMGQGHPTMGIIGSSGRALIPGAVGLLSVPRWSAIKAWRVG